MKTPNFEKIVSGLSIGEWVVLGLGAYILVKNLPSIIGGVTQTAAQSAGATAATLPAQIIGGAAQGAYQGLTNPATNPLYNVGASIGDWLANTFQTDPLANDPTVVGTPAYNAAHGLAGYEKIINPLR